MDEAKLNKIEIATQEDTLDLNASIEVHLHNLTPQDFKEQFIEDYFKCCLCGDELEFTHVTHFVNQNVCEEAFCPSCRVRTRKADHRLQ